MTVPHSYRSTIDLLNELAEFLGDYADVRDGAYGEQVPNQAMHLQNSVEREIERLKRSSGPESEALDALQWIINRAADRHPAGPEAQLIEIVRRAQGVLSTATTEKP
jgi:hypothetical protein